MYRFFCHAVYFSGLAWIIRHVIARNKVTIVLYHSPDKDLFESHINYLQKYYTFIELDTLIGAIQNKSQGLPKYSLIVTFDDGHRNNFGLKEIFKKINVRPTVYLCSSIVATNRRYWFRLPGLRSSILKRMDHSHRLQYLLKEFDFSPEREYPEQPREALSQEELSIMTPVTDFQSHTCSHPVLTTCSAEVSEVEIFESRHQLENLLGSKVNHFAYPNGDYGQREIDLLKKSGYVSGRTTDIGWNNYNSDPYRLKITGVSDHADLVMLKAELSGVPGYFYNLLANGIYAMAFLGKHVPESKKI